MRLTKKNNKLGSWTQLVDDYLPAHNIKHKQCVNKLGRIEDTEEELGLDLIIYHRIMNMLYCGEPNNVYIKEADNIVEAHILEIDYCKKKIIFYKGNYEDYDDEYVYGFYQYAELWALTKEELKK